VPLSCPIQPTPPSYILQIHFNIFRPSTTGSSKRSLSRRFPHQNTARTCLLPHTFCICDVTRSKLVIISTNIEGDCRLSLQGIPWRVDMRTLLVCYNNYSGLSWYMGAFNVTFSFHLRDPCPSSGSDTSNNSAPQIRSTCEAEPCRHWWLLLVGGKVPCQCVNKQRGCRVSQERMIPLQIGTLAPVPYSSAYRNVGGWGVSVNLGFVSESAFTGCDESREKVRKWRSVSFSCFF
jgi:hypothetical protein